MDERRRTLPSIASLFYTCKQSNRRSFPDITWNQMKHRFQTRSETRGTRTIKATFPQSYWFLYGRNNLESCIYTALCFPHFHILIKHAAISHCTNNLFRARNELEQGSHTTISALWHRNYRQGGKSGNTSDFYSSGVGLESRREHGLSSLITFAVFLSLSTQICTRWWIRWHSFVYYILTQHVSSQIQIQHQCHKNNIHTNEHKNKTEEKNVLQFS
jgi:hypothetical protein